MKVVLAGGSGFIGRRLTAALAGAGHHVAVLSRRSGAGSVRTIVWDGRTQGPWAEEVRTADAVVNLAGESIAARRWTRAQKELLRSSRLDPTRALVRAMTSRTTPGTLVSTSAVGYYGDVPDGVVTEEHPPGTGFLADLSVEWESAAREAESSGTRVVLPRIGVVLDRNGGALERMVPFFRSYLGGPLGSGRQWFPWVHLDDVVGAILFALATPALAGPANLTAPHPVSMKVFAASLGRALGRPSWAPVPPFALRLLLGEMAGMLLGGQRAVPAALLRHGYTFRHPELDPALVSALS